MTATSEFSNQIMDEEQLNLNQSSKKTVQDKESSSSAKKDDLSKMETSTTSIDGKTRPHLKKENIGERNTFAQNNEIGINSINKSIEYDEKRIYSQEKENKTEDSTDIRVDIADDRSKTIHKSSHDKSPNYIIEYDSNSQKNNSSDDVIPRIEFDRRIEYFSHIWLLNRRGIDPLDMIDSDSTGIIKLYETDPKKILLDYHRLKRSTERNDISDWHLREIAEYIISREVESTYVNSDNDEYIISKQEINKEIDRLVESFVKGLSE